MASASRALSNSIILARIASERSLFVANIVVSSTEADQEPHALCDALSATSDKGRLKRNFLSSASAARSPSTTRLRSGSSTDPHNRIPLANDVPNQAGT